MPYMDCEGPDHLVHPLITIKVFSAHQCTVIILGIGLQTV